MHHLTVDGSIRIARRVYWSPESGVQRPLDGWLGIEDASVSRGARELCGMAAMAGGSFLEGTEVLWRLGQLRVSDEQLRTLTEAEGRRQTVEHDQRGGPHGLSLPQTQPAVGTLLGRPGTSGRVMCQKSLAHPFPCGAHLYVDGRRALWYAFVSRAGSFAGAGGGGSAIGDRGALGAVAAPPSADNMHICDS